MLYTMQVCFSCVVSHGFSNWKKTEAFTKHQRSDGHRHAVEAHSTWLKQIPIDQRINEEAKIQESARQIEVCNCNAVRRI